LRKKIHEPVHLNVYGLSLRRVKTEKTHTLGSQCADLHTRMGRRTEKAVRKWKCLMKSNPGTRWISFDALGKAVSNAGEREEGEMPYLFLKSVPCQRGKEDACLDGRGGKGDMGGREAAGMGARSERMLNQPSSFK